MAMDLPAPPPLESHRQTLQRLEAHLDAIAQEHWERPLAEGGWCPAEVYHHIGLIAEGYAFPRLERCLAGQGDGRAFGLLGRVVFWVGGIPGFLKIRIPFPPELQPRVISREEARQLLARLRTRAEAFAPRVGAADPRVRVRHLKLGGLNAEGWFRFVEMHHRHHLEGQLARLSA